MLISYFDTPNFSRTIFFLSLFRLKLIKTLISNQCLRQHFTIFFLASPIDFNLKFRDKIEKRSLEPGQYQSDETVNLTTIFCSILVSFINTFVEPILVQNLYFLLKLVVIDLHFLKPYTKLAYYDVF